LVFENLLIKSLTKNATGLIQDFSILLNADDMVNAGFKKYFSYYLAMARHNNHETWLALSFLQQLSQFARGKVVSAAIIGFENQFAVIAIDTDAMTAEVQPDRFVCQAADELFNRGPDLLDLNRNFCIF
jgi:hypothetical protein